MANATDKKPGELKIKILPVSIQTPDNLQFVYDELTNFVNVLTQAGRRKAAGGKPSALPTLSAASLEVLRILPEKSRSDVKAIDQIAQELMGIIKAAPVVNITLAGPPPLTLKTALTEWFRQNTNQNTLVAFHVNPDIAGGMVVRTVNEVHDFSFRKGLLAHPEKMIEVIERV